MRHASMFFDPGDGTSTTGSRKTGEAAAEDSVAMATAMKLATQAGRYAFLSGRMPKKLYASASSPLVGVVR